jgi:hypothetical protein
MLLFMYESGNAQSNAFQQTVQLGRYIATTSDGSVYAKLSTGAGGIEEIRDIRRAGAASEIRSR